MYDAGLPFSTIDNARNGNISSCINKLHTKQTVKICKVCSFPSQNKNKLGHICTCVHAYIVNFYLDFHTCPFLEISRQ